MIVGESTYDDEISDKIVPKGLRAFDQEDAEFFLQLVPGPRDRYGLPDSLRFWKTRIESPSVDNTFSVGVPADPFEEANPADRGEHRGIRVH